MLLYAFIGGLILNIMPCVLPVIALKILGFVGESRSNPQHVRTLGLVYALGVLVSFLALAAVIIGVKAAGHYAGWGMQFGNPVFVVCLTTLVLLVALNLFGVFEVTLGRRALDAAGGLASKQGAPGAFFNGVLATALATPCTAPFLSIALGFAFAQKAPLIVLTFLAVGAGLAAPYVALSWNPAWLKLLPKPGAWMEKFKIAMGFPMLATAVWLFNLAARQLRQNGFVAGCFSGHRCFRRLDLWRICPAWTGWQRPGVRGGSDFAGGRLRFCARKPVAVAPANGHSGSNKLAGRNQWTASTGNAGARKPSPPPAPPANPSSWISPPIGASPAR